MNFPMPGLPLDRTSAFGFVLLLAFLSLAPPTEASRIQGLYEAQVVVPDREGESRGAAISAALSKVLVKVSGNPAMASAAELADVLRDAARYVQQYRYDPMPQMEGPVAEPAWLLVARFDPDSIDRLLRERHLPVWGDQRPETLLWLVSESAGRRTLAGSENDPEVLSLLSGLTEERGVRVLLPILDLEDRANLQPADVWGDFSRAILDASARYRPDAVLVGRAGRDADQWLVRWTLYQGDNRDRWDTRAASRRDAIGDGLAQNATYLAERFAPRSIDGLPTSVRVDVADVTSFDAYTRVERYLREISAVADTQVERVENDWLRFRLQVRGGEESLQRAISLGTTLVPAPPIDVISTPPEVREAPLAPDLPGAVTLPLDSAQVEPADSLAAVADTAPLEALEPVAPSVSQTVNSLSYRLVP